MFKLRFIKIYSLVRFNVPKLHNTCFSVGVVRLEGAFNVRPAHDAVDGSFAPDPVSAERLKVQELRAQLLEQFALERFLPRFAPLHGAASEPLPAVAATRNDASVSPHKRKGVGVGNVLLLQRRTERDEINWFTPLRRPGSEFWIISDKLLNHLESTNY